MNAYEARQETKHEDERYRKAAARLTGNSVAPDVAVNRPANREAGAFVEVIVWVPREEMEKEGSPAFSVEAARLHHEKHGDMEGTICLLGACALHYPEGKQ
jgi:hypothetical protein